MAEAEVQQRALAQQRQVQIIPMQVLVGIEARLTAASSAKTA